MNNKLDIIIMKINNYENKYCKRHDYYTLTTENGIYQQIKSQINKNSIFVNYLNEIHLYDKKLWEVIEEIINISDINESTWYNKRKQNEYNITT